MTKKSIEDDEHCDHSLSIRTEESQLLPNCWRKIDD